MNRKQFRKLIPVKIVSKEGWVFLWNNSFLFFLERMFVNSISSFSRDLVRILNCLSPRPQHSTFFLDHEWFMWGSSWLRDGDMLDIFYVLSILTLHFNPSRPNPRRREKIKLNFYFHTLWCQKRFYKGLKDLHKTFWGTTKKCENKNLT